LSAGDVTYEELVRRVTACLSVHDDAFREALRSVLRERTFPPHPRHRGKPPCLDTSDELRGVRIIYTWGHWVPSVCGVSVAGAWKCGARQLFPVGIAFFEAIEEAASPRDARLSDVEWEQVESWIRRAWLDVRSVAPSLRGFVSEHDTVYLTDLDTGIETTEADLGLGYL
jgi:hypothetical protein